MSKIKHKLFIRINTTKGGMTLTNTALAVDRMSSKLKDKEKDGR